METILHFTCKTDYFSICCPWPPHLSSPLGQVMDITTILNRKQSAALVAAEGPFQQQFVPSPFGSPSSPRMKPEPGVSDAGDHQVLAYPTHAPLGQMNLHQGLQYAPRTQPSTSMPLMQNAYYPGGYANTSPMPNSIAAAPTGRADPPPKTFYCSTCNKGFARRSDLARHGTSSSPDHAFSCING